MKTLVLAEDRGDFTAIAPASQVDLVLLAKHAKLSDKLRMKKHLAIASLWMAYIIGFIFLNIFSHSNEEFLNIGLLMLFAILAIIIVITENHWRLRYIMQNFIDSNNYKNIKMQIGNEQMLEEVNGGNICYYGGNKPYVGHGDLVHGWSFAINISAVSDKSSENINTPIIANELYDVITAAIKNLQIEGLTVRDIICINGLTLKENAVLAEKFLPRIDGPPLPTLPLTFADMEAISGGDCRAYKCIRTVAWRGELELSVFLRIRLSTYLFIEANYYLLTPLKAKYRSIDYMKKKNASHYWLAASGNAVTWGPALLILSPLYLAYRFLKPFLDSSKGSNILAELDMGNPYNYGATSSVRENCSTKAYTNFFQIMDKEMCIKLTEKAILDSIDTFLKNRGVDVREFENKRTVIVNHGIMVSGGEVKADTINIGKRVRSYVDGIGDKL